MSGQAPLRSAAAQARQAAFYRELGAADTAEGRFELYSLHVALLLVRLKGRGAAAAETAQALFDAFVRSLDDALREMGVGEPDGAQADEDDGTSVLWPRPRL